MKKLHPATIVISLLPRLKEALQAALPLLLGSLASGRDGNHEWIPVFIGAFTGIFAIGTYWTTRFDIEPDHIVHRTGWIFRKDRRIPLEQIQNVSLRQNVLERIFKVATVDVETAMGKGRDLKLSVLGLADAERFREELLGAAHLDALGAPKVDEPLVSLNRHDLFLGAVTENHLLQMFVVMFTLPGPVLGWVMKYAAKLPTTLAAALFGVALVLLIVSGWVWGALSYYLKYGGFVVRRNENVFRISYGLLNKVQMAIRPGRIEYLQLTASLPQRWMRRASFQVGTASSFGEAGVLAPVALFVERYRAYASASDVIPGLEIAKLRWQPFHAFFYLSAVIRSAIFFVILSLLVVTVTSFASGTAVIVTWMSYLVMSALIFAGLASRFLSKPENGFAITEDAVVLRQGYFQQTITAMPIERIENIAVNQPSWWRKRKAVKVTIQAMKHPLHMGAIPESAIEDLMERWRLKIEKRENRQLYAALAAEAEEVTLELGDGEADNVLPTGTA